MVRHESIAQTAKVIHLSLIKGRDACDLDLWFHGVDYMTDGCFSNNFESVKFTIK